MKAPIKVNSKTALRFRQIFVLFILILSFIIVSLSAEAKGRVPKVDDRYTIIKKQNKVYSNACALMKEKRNKKEKAKSYKYKYR